MTERDRGHIRLKNQPKYRIGELCLYTIEVEDALTKLKFSHDIECYISWIKADGTSVKDTYSYGLSLDLPGCYYSGKPVFKEVLEDDIRLADKIMYGVGL